MKINIVHKEEGGWILKKFAEKLKYELNLLNCDVTISDEPKADVDINHYVFHEFFQRKSEKAIDSLMITHIDSVGKENRIVNFLDAADVGIAMSQATQIQLYKLGISNKKLFYINPAHDSNIRTRKRIIGITTNLYPDGRKNENYLLEVIGILNPSLFKLIIIGNNWDAIIAQLRNNKFEVDYYEFNYSLYHSVLPTFDFYLYFGFDEGSMGVLDAMSTGAHIVTTPQGFHLDFNSSNITFIKNRMEFGDFLKKINKMYSLSIESVKNWTWNNYSKKHLEIWNYLLERENANLLTSRDGLNSAIKRRNYLYSCNRFLKTLFISFYTHTPKFIKELYQRYIK